MTNLGTPLPLDATTIECFGIFNGKVFVRTKSGLSHLIEGDIFQHTQRWDAALRGEQVLDVIDVKVESSVVGNRSSVIEDGQRTSDLRLQQEKKRLPPASKRR